MTLPNDRIGDKGQRFQVEAFGYPVAEQWHTIGWSDTEVGAQHLADTVKLAPSCSSTRITDRKPSK